MSIDQTIAEAIAAEMEATVSSQMSSVAIPGRTIAATVSWNGTSTVTWRNPYTPSEEDAPYYIEASAVVAGQYVRDDANGVWYLIESVAADYFVVSDFYSTGSFPAGSAGSSIALVDPPPPLEEGSMSTFAESIAAAFGGTPHELPSVTVSNLPSASPAGRMVYVINASGGAVPAFSDGAAWRRVDTSAIVT